MRVVGFTLALMMAGGMAHAQQTTTQDPMNARPRTGTTPNIGGWIDVGFGHTIPADDSLSQSFTGLPDVAGERETATTTYEFPGRNGVVAGGGVRFGNFGVGVGVQVGSTKDVSGTQTFRAPHPLRVNRFAEDSANFDDFERKETAVHISAAYIVGTGSNFQTRIYGGPTKFTGSGDAVTDVAYNQQWVFLTGFNNVDITDIETKEVDVDAWGFHAGVDAGYFFTNNIGIGFGAIFSRAEAELDDDDLLADDPADIKLGGLTIHGGLRIRF